MNTPLAQQPFGSGVGNEGGAGVDYTAIIPELLLQKILADMILELQVSVDHNPADNLITKMFGALPTVGKLDYAKEAIGFFNKKNLDTRRLTIKVGYSLSNEELPRINIVLPEESEGRQQIGMQEEDTIIEGVEGGEMGVAVINASEATKARYMLMIVSDNADLTVILFHIFKYMFLRYRDVIELAHFDNFRVTGNDLIMDQANAPKTLFARALNLTFEYEITAERLNQPILGKSMIVTEKSLLI